MQEVSNAKTKEFRELFNKRDALGIDIFTNKNEAYKNIYRVFKGRFYFTEQDSFDFQMSPDNKTVALICRLKDNSSHPHSCGSNLEIHIARADKDGDFHRTEQIRYECNEDVRFDCLENEAITLHHQDTPGTPLKHKLKPLARELSLSEQELVDVLLKEAKLKRLQELKELHYNLGKKTNKPDTSNSYSRVSAARGRIPPADPQKVSTWKPVFENYRNQSEYNYAAVDCMSIL